MASFSRFALTFLLNAAWQILLVAMVAWLCDRLLRQATAQQRHWLWIAAFVLCLLLPLLSTFDLFRDEGAPTATREIVAIQVEGTEPHPFSPPSALTGLLRNRPRPFSPTPILTGLALVCYWLSLLLHAVSFVRAWRRTRALLAHSETREIPEPLAATITRCQQAFGLSAVALRYSPEIACPVTVGKHTILWPEQLGNVASPEVLTAALGHEMAHLKRCDCALNVLYEILSLPLAFHPALVFIKRRIQHTRELACDEMVTATMIDAPTYARSLLSLAQTMTEFRRPGFSLGVFDADILEERIMKLIERKPRMSKRKTMALLLAASLIIALSSALAAVLSLKVEQTAAKSIVGNWEMYLTEDGQDPKGTALEFPVGLNLQLEGDKLVGKANFPWMQETAEGTKKAGTSIAALHSLTYAENKLSFIIEGTDKGDFLEMKLQLVGEKFEGRWKILRSGEAGSVKVQRVQNTSSLIEKIVGEWTVSLFAGDGAKAEGDLPTLIVKAEGNRLRAKTVFHQGGEKKEWVLIDPKFDGETFLFKVDNGEEILEGKLKWMEDRFEGPWKASQSGASGTMKLLRKK